MSEWKECKLGDVIFFGNGKARPKNEGIIPIYGGNGILGYCNQYNYQDETIIIGRVGAYCGSVFYENKSIWVSDNALSAKPKERNNTKFLFYFLKNLELNQFAEGSSHPLVTQTLLNSIDIEIPEKVNEQSAIASVLSSLDDKIDLLNRQNKTLEAMAETLFRQWFVEEAEDGWEEKELNEILEFVVDNRGRTAPTSDTGIPLIATNCIKNENIYPLYEKVRYVDQETYNDWFRAHPKPGDIIFVNKGTPGCVNFVPDPVDFCIAQDMVALRVCLNSMSRYYLFLFLRSNEIQSQILNSSVGTTIPHLKKTDLLKFIIEVPPKKILDNFDSKVSTYFSKMNINMKQIRTLSTLRDTLLPKLMSGEVRVSEHDYRIKGFQD
ncbi:MAG: restriction endonuclease subunit S [Desulfobacterales bacterium]|nr:restriction endonuclease subunit S [Desulfobacterales bacterium]